MMIRALMKIAAAIALLTACAAHAEAPHASVFGKAPLADTALAGMRGGFALPGGLDVSIAVRSDTAIDGTAVLRTVFRADRGPAQLAILARTGGSDALSQLTLRRGESIDTGRGRVSLSADGGRVTLSTAGFDATHLAGQAYGSIGANRLDNVGIDTTTTIDIGIRGATAFNLGSAMSRVGTLAVDAAARLAR
jgi:hypothetical protein